MPRAKKFEKGRVVLSVYDLADLLERREWLWMAGKPKHCSVIASMTFHTLALMVRKGFIHVANRVGGQSSSDAVRAAQVKAAERRLGGDCFSMDAHPRVAQTPQGAHVQAWFYVSHLDVDPREIAPHLQLQPGCGDERCPGWVAEGNSVVRCTECACWKTDKAARNWVEAVSQVRCFWGSEEAMCPQGETLESVLEEHREIADRARIYLTK